METGDVRRIEVASADVLARLRMRRPDSWAEAEGVPTPLGAVWLPAERAWNFALHSKHAEDVALLLYSAEDTFTPIVECRLDPRIHRSGRVWHCRLDEAEVRGASHYAYRVSGPQPEGQHTWHAFDPEKVLFDPYARCLHFPRDFERGAAMRPGSNAGRAPLGVLRLNDYPWPAAGPNPRHESDLILYELHVGGFTRDASSGVHPSRRGTFLGVIDRISYLLDLGITAVELMPVFQWDPQEGNYWGYMPISLFAPHSGYACTAGEQISEFRQMISALHGAGIEVILDVVYNHTGEGGARGPVYTLKGIDNSTYYYMTGDPSSPYADFSGAGNTLHADNATVRRLILDSLRFWVTEMNVDGFRFDLASIFSRGGDGAIDLTRPCLFAEISADPVISSARLIAEPWDVSGYQLGVSFPGLSWRQWNDRFRDDLRRFVRGDPGMTSTLATRLYGSDDLFPDDRLHAFHPYQSINYVTCHDGFTLYDLVAYDRKRNWANGHANTDGEDDNYSWNSGWEGDEGVPSEILELRRRQAHNLICLVLLANGTPMLRSGDEFLQTQGGNNNAYNQDNETSWLNWNRREIHADFHRFVRLMIAFRKRHPSICRSRFWRDDVTWFDPEGSNPPAPDSAGLAYHLKGGSQADADLYVMINPALDGRRFRIAVPSDRWMRVIDTAQLPPGDIAEPGAEIPFEGEEYTVQPRSLVVLMGRGP